jgi:hypothetical protein
MPEVCPIPVEPNGGVMKTIVTIFTTALLLSVTGLKAQPNILDLQGFTLRPVVTPKSVIDGHQMGSCVGVWDVAMNDLGDVAFSAKCGDEDILFTNRRALLKAGDQIDGKLINTSPTVLAINNHGQVLYTAHFSEDSTDTFSNEFLGPRGVFLDKAFIGVDDYVNDKPVEYSLTEDGRVLSAIGSDNMPQPTLPIDYDLGTCQTHDPNGKAIPAAERMGSNGTVLSLTHNHCGQLLIIVNHITPFLLVATPINP